MCGEGTALRPARGLSPCPLTLVATWICLPLLVLWYGVVRRRGRPDVASLRRVLECERYGSAGVCVLCPQALASLPPVIHFFRNVEKLHAEHAGDTDVSSFAGVMCTLLHRELLVRVPSLSVASTVHNRAAPFETPLCVWCGAACRPGHACVFDGVPDQGERSPDQVRGLL